MSRQSEGLIAATRVGDWRSKFADISLFLGVANLVNSPLDPWLRTSTMAFTAGHLTFGYAFNDYCDRHSDARAGKDLRASPSTMLMIATAGLFAALASLILLGWRSPDVWPAGLAALVFAWQYSAAPLRLKERGFYGVLIGALAQRFAPASVVSVALGMPWDVSTPWLVWMGLWGTRGIVVHQATDRANDERSGVKTWVSKQRDLRAPLLLVQTCAVLELLAVGWAFLCLKLLYVLAGAFCLWCLLTYFVLRAKRVKRDPVSWLSFHYVPLADFYDIVLPLAVDGLLIGRLWSSTWYWVLVDLTIRVPVFRQLRDHLHLAKDGPWLEESEWVARRRT